MLKVITDLLKRKKKFVTEKYCSRFADRYWWWRMYGGAKHDPILYYLLDKKEISILNNWYDDTDKKHLVGECAPPMMGFLFGFIANNYIKRIVQLGHYSGFSTLNLGFLLSHLGEGRLATIDIDERMSNYTEKWVDKAKLKNYIKIITADSADSGAIRQSIDFIGGEPEIVIIDSAHTYNHTLRELDAWMPVLCNNGFIFLHDSSLWASHMDKEGRGGRKECPSGLVLVSRLWFFHF
jgi:predicted O-methyltransferase YrrM